MGTWPGNFWKSGDNGMVILRFSSLNFLGFGNGKGVNSEERMRMNGWRWDDNFHDFLILARPSLGQSWRYTYIPTILNYRKCNVYYFTRRLTLLLCSCSDQ